MRYLVPLGRVLFAALFLQAVPGLFSARTAAMAGQHGVPLPHLLVPLSGLLALLGGLSVALGFRAKWGAWLLVVFLLPVTVAMHNYWAVKDPMLAMSQHVSFMKNISMLGASLMIAHFVSGPLSTDKK